MNKKIIYNMMILIVLSLILGIFWRIRLKSGKEKNDN